jgi:rhodanese-related sulfurtransferase
MKPDNVMPRFFDQGGELRPNSWKIVPVLSQSLAILLLAGALAVMVNLWRPASVPFHYHRAQKVQLASAMGEDVWISVEEAEPLFARKKALFIDARPSGLYEQEHISGALNMAVDSFHGSFEKMKGKIPPEAMIIVYCDGRASERSAALAGELLLRGYGNVRVLERGWDLWVAQELPIESGDDANSAGAGRRS